VVDVYVDNDVSAWSGKRRPEYSRLLEDLGSGDVDAVVVWHADRLHRHPRELEEFIEICAQAGVSDLASVTGDIDLATETGRLTARILGAVARKESDDKSTRIKRKHLELAAKGKVSGGGARPYGFEADRVKLNEPEAKVIREVARRALSGESVRSLCTDLNKRGVTTSTGRQWSAQTMRRMLLSGRISGQREHKGEIVADAEWPAIITPEDGARLRAKLRDSSRRASRNPRRYLLAGGLVRCGLCDMTMVSRPRHDGVRRYVCARDPGLAGCGKTATVAEPLETLVVEAVLYRLDTPELDQALTKATAANDALTELRSQLVRDEEQLEILAAEWGNATITRSEWFAARTPIQARIDLARKRLARLSPTAIVEQYAGQGNALREAWSDLPLTRQNAIIKSVLDHVAVASAVRGRNTFDPNRFTPIWRL